ILIYSSHWVWRLLVCQRMTGVISAEASFPLAKLRVRRPGIVMSRPDGVDPLRRWIAWGAMLTGSVVPMMFGHPTGHGPPYSVPATQALVLAVAAIVASRSRRLSPLTGFLFTVAILRLGWSVIAPMLGELGPVQSFVAEINWGPKIFMSRLLNVRNVLPVREALWLTAIFFGSAHYFGQPSGPIGIIMATIAGWIWAKSMVETRGAGWAFGIHMVQDVVIFYFLALSMKN